MGGSLSFSAEKPIFHVNAGPAPENTPTKGPATLFPDSIQLPWAKGPTGQGQEPPCRPRVPSIAPRHKLP